MLGIYFFRNHKDYFKKFGKERLIGFISSSLDKELNKLENNPFKDSLKVLMKNEIKFVQETKLENGMKKFGYIVDRVKEYSRDGKIDSTEFVNLKIMVAGNEESEKN